MSLEICPADIGHSFQSCAFGETVWPHFVLEEPSNCINRAGSAGTDFSLRKVPENSKRRNQENTGNRIRVLYLYFHCEAHPSEGRMARTACLDHKLQEVSEWNLRALRQRTLTRMSSVSVERSAKSGPARLELRQRKRKGWRRRRECLRPNRRPDSFCWTPH